MRHATAGRRSRKMVLRAGRRSWRRFPGLIAAVFLPLLALLLTVVPAAAAIIPQTGPTSATSIAQAIAAPVTNVTGASFVTTTGGTPNGISTAPLAGFGSAGGSFGILTTGNVNSVPQVGTQARTDNGGAVIPIRGTTAFDISILKIDVNVPPAANCLTFDFKFLSEEFPIFTATQYNDAFIAELDNSTWKTNNATITAPNNFAFDAAGKVISVNALGVGAFSTLDGTDTTFSGGDTTDGGATGLLRASTQITPGSHSVYFSIFDQGDRTYDSAVFLDNLVVGFVANPAANCKPGAQPANFKLALTPANGTSPAGGAHTVTAKLTEADGTAVGNAPLGFTVAGANTTGGTSTTNSSGAATFTYTGTNAGTDQIAVCYQQVGAPTCLAQAAATWDWTAAATSLNVAMATGIYGGTATLSATLTQGGTPVANQPVAFALNGNPAGTATTDPNGVATVTPPTSLGPIGAGSYPGALGASFVGSPGLLASNGTGTLLVAPAPLTVVPDNQSRTYGAANPPLTGMLSGVVNGDNITASYGTTASSGSPVGTYAIVPTLADPDGKLANYAVTSANRTLTVTQAPLTVTADNKTKVYGQPDPAPTFTVGGLVNGDTPTTAFTTPPICALAGTTITCSGAVAPNYAVTYAPGTLTLAPAPLTVTANNQSRSYGDPNPPFTATATGLVNGDTLAGIGITCASVATATSPVGTYDITCTGTPANYVVTFAKGTLTVTKVPTQLAITSGGALALGADGKVTATAKLTTQNGTPLAGKTVTFSAGSGTVSGTTNTNGVATAQLALPSAQYVLTASYAGDANYLPSQAAQTVIAYQLTRFVIWGGNAGGVATGKTYQFWGAQWAKQVTGGDYQANSSFKGYADSLSPDGKTWTASPGGSGNPPATVAPYIGVIVATHATKGGSTISGNVDRIVVLKVDAPSSYQPNPGHAGTGVLVATLP